MGLGLPQTPTPDDADRAPLVQRVSDDGLGLLSACGYKCRACAVDRVAALRAISRRREAGSRAGAAYARAVLQLPCSQVQSEYGLDAFVGRNHPVLSALV